MTKPVCLLVDAARINDQIKNLENLDTPGSCTHHAGFLFTPVLNQPTNTPAC